jgi:uncharacterized protein
MFFALLGLIVIGLGSIPLIIALARSRRTAPQQQRRGIKRGAWFLAVVVAGLFALNLFLGFYTDYLWFLNLGFASRFWTVLGTSVGLFVAGTLIAFACVYASFRVALAPDANNGMRGIGLVLSVLAALMLGGPAATLWNRYLLYVNQVASPLTDPIYGRPVNFYLFSLPLYTSVANWLIALLVLCGGATVAGALASLGGTIGRPPAQLRLTPSASVARRLSGLVLLLAGVLLLVLAFEAWIGVYRLLNSRDGVVNGVGFTDAYVRRPAYYLTMLVLGLSGVYLLVASVSGRARRLLFPSRSDEPLGIFHGSRRLFWVSVMTAGALLTALWIVPALVQTFIVGPNELVVERPFLEHSIRFTRHGFGIDSSRVETRRYPVGTGAVNNDVIQKNRATIENIRLWDPRALLDNLKQLQEIRLYYVFSDIDIDRYTIGDNYRQVMLGARELQQADLNPRSRTWLSEHLIYTHGFGLVMLPVNEFLPGGQPRLFIEDIPPKINRPSLTITQPRVYYGENTWNYVYAPTRQEEFDYPQGDTNAYTHYEGTGGVPIGNWFTRFAYAWRFNDYQLLFSAYFTNRSRVHFRRLIRERAETVLPFLRFDDDPYVVLTPEGRMKFILDAYTLSGAFPYSERYAGKQAQYRGVNYMRNAVKVVIDAYDGSMVNYIADTSDVLIRSYHQAFAGLFTPFDQMPPAIRNHIRYPEAYLLVQSEMFAVYHMTDPVVFYQREDVWQFATERYRDDFQDVEPYYVMVQFPEEQRVEYVLMVPFTPQNRNVMHAWMAGRCDAENYGKIIVYPFSKGNEVLGPRQVEALIDQNAEMSRNISLWNQGGSSVIRGNLLAVPLFDSESRLEILYVEPIFLQATDARIPEVRRVVVGDQQGVVWAPTFDEALRKLVAGQYQEEVSDSLFQNETSPQPDTSDTPR